MVIILKLFLFFSIPVCVYFGTDNGWLTAAAALYIIEQR